MKTHRLSSRPLHRIAAATLLASGTLISFGTLAAPSAAERAAIDATWRADRASCLDGSSGQERSACLAEAATARKEALAGRLGVIAVDGERLQPTEADLQANALARCDAVPADVRGDCERRVAGGDDVIVAGSVAGGGMLRELRTEVPPMMLAMAGAAAADGDLREFDEDGPEAGTGAYEAYETYDAGESAGLVLAEPVEPPMEAPPADENDSLRAWDEEAAADLLAEDGLPYIDESMPVPDYASEDAGPALQSIDESIPPAPSVHESEPLPGVYPEWMRPIRLQ